MTDFTHFYPSGAVAHSVLTSTPVQAACGLTRTLTRESVEAANSHPTCADCLAAVAAERTPEREPTIRPHTGWTGMLESDLLARYRDDAAFPARLAEHEAAVKVQAFNDYADWIENVHGENARKSIRRMIAMLRDRAGAIERQASR